MKENKWIDNSRTKIGQCVGAKAQDGKNALNHNKKNNNGRNFQFAKFSFIDFVLTDRRNLPGKRPHRPVANLPDVDCRSQPREMPLPKPPNT